MVVDPDVDVHNTKTRNHSDKRKKQRPMENVMNIECQNIFPTLKSISKSEVGTRFLHLACQWGGSHPCLHQLRY